MGGRSSREKSQDESGESFGSKYTYGPAVGKGGYGIVLEVKPVDAPQMTGAVKVTENKGSEGEFWSEIAVFHREVALLQSMEHENVLRFWDSFIDEKNLYVVTELCAGGQVFEQLIRRNPFRETDAAAVATQMLLAIEYIHGKSILHRDIKAENFMFLQPSPDSTVKMIDFGMSSRFQNGEVFHEKCGSRFSYAPEMLKKRYDHRVDIWAFGVMMYLLCCGRYPFTGLKQKKLKVADLHRPLVWKQKVPLSPETKDFIQRLLQVNSDERLTAKEALIHPFIGYLDDSASAISHASRVSLNTILSESVKQALEVVRVMGNGTASGSRGARNDFEQRLSTPGSCQASSPKTPAGPRSNGLIAWERQVSKSSKSSDASSPKTPAGPRSNGSIAWERQVSKSSDSASHTKSHDSSRGQCMFPQPTPRQGAALPENGPETEVSTWDLGPEVRSSSRRISKGSGHADKRKNGLGREGSTQDDGLEVRSSSRHGSKELRSSSRRVSKGSDNAAMKDSSTLPQPVPPVQRAVNCPGTEGRSWDLGTEVDRKVSKGSDSEPTSPSYASSSCDASLVKGGSRVQAPLTKSLRSSRSNSFKEDDDSSTLIVRKPRNLRPLTLMPNRPSDANRFSTG